MAEMPRHDERTMMTGGHGETHYRGNPVSHLVVCGRCGLYDPTSVVGSLVSQPHGTCVGQVLSPANRTQEAVPWVTPGQRMEEGGHVVLTLPSLLGGACGVHRLRQQQRHESEAGRSLNYRVEAMCPPSHGFAFA